MEHERIREFQWTELKKLLAHVFASVPYLRHKYRAAGIALEDLQGWDDFRRLPPLTRAEVNAHGRESVFDGVQGEVAPARHRRIDGRAHPLFPDLRELRLANGGQGPCVFLDGLAPRTARTLLVGRADRLGALATGGEDARIRRGSASVDRQHLFQSDALWDDVYARALKFRPLLVVGYVSSLEAFAAFLGRTKRTLPSVRCAIAAAEPLHDDARQRIQEALGVPLFNTYGSREFMSIAAECEQQDGLHVHAENLVVETRDLLSSQPSEILVTDLHNYGMPFVRYATGDLGRLSDASCSAVGACRCSTPSKAASWTHCAPPTAAPFPASSFLIC